MKIGILGSGIVGRVLGNAFAQEGYEVMLGTRDTSKDEVQKWLKENPKASAGSFSDTAAFGEMLVLAVAGHAAEELIKLAEPINFTGKTIIDATNPIADAPPVNGVLQFFTNHNESLMEKLQKYLPNAHLVKAFSCVGNAFMYKPDFGAVKPTMFICGNSDEAKKTVTDILDKFGWEIADMGKSEAARAIEPLSMLWCIPGFLNNEWTHAFKLMKK